METTDYIQNRVNTNIHKFEEISKKYRKRQVICWIENHSKKIDNYIEN